jgi:hypothetical protein
MTENQNQNTENMTTDRGMLTGMFRDRESTENAFNAMQERSYSNEDYQFSDVRRNMQETLFI